MTEAQHTDYRKFSEELAKSAGFIIKNNFTLGMKREWKSDGSPLTATDLAVNTLVIDSVRKFFPSHSVLAEEGDNFSDSSEYVWVCDPLDGTIPFSHGVPTCVFSLALVHRGQSIMGVIYDPFMDRLFFAEKGKGAFLNGGKISVSGQSVLKNAMVGLVDWKGAPYSMSKFSEELKNEMVKIMNVNSITYMGALVASGEFAAIISPGKKPHDAAALKIIVEEAGGKVTDLFGDDQRYDRELRGYLVSNSALQARMLELIRKTVG